MASTRWQRTVGLVVDKLMCKRNKSDGSERFLPTLQLLVVTQLARETTPYSPVKTACINS
jgi:hypothetical protein